MKRHYKGHVSSHTAEGEQSQKCLQHFHSEQNPFTLNSPHSVCELNTGLLLLGPDALTNERVCDCLTVWMSECEIYSWDHPLRHRQGSVWRRGSRQLGYRWWGTRTKVMVLMRTIDDQLVIDCLFYDVSQMNAIKLIGWSEQQRVQQAEVMMWVAVHFSVSRITFTSAVKCRQCWWKTCSCKVLMPD